MNNLNKPFSDLLKGESAFFRQEDYLEKTKAEMFQTERLPVTYTWNTDKWKNKVNLIEGAKLFFSNVAFPVPFYKTLQGIAAEFVLPASGPIAKSKLKLESPQTIRQQIKLDNKGWVYKRLTIAVDGHEIDVMIMGKWESLGNKKWFLLSNGNGGLCEKALVDDKLKLLLSESAANLITFNYPGVAGSSGVPNKKTMAKAYRAVLSFLEDKENGIGAEKIIGFGHSIGGGVQGQALKKHVLKDEIKYVFVKSRTFTSIKQLVSLNNSKSLGSLIDALNFNLDSVKSSKALKVPEIIMQTAGVDSCKVIQSKTDLETTPFKSDGVIPLNAILAAELLPENPEIHSKKCFLAIPELHNEQLRRPTRTKLAELISEALKEDLE